MKKIQTLAKIRVINECNAGRSEVSEMDHISFAKLQQKTCALSLNKNKIMTVPEKIYDAKRKNFVSKAKLFFKFLQTEFNFREPEYSYSEQANGIVISDKFVFKNIDESIQLTISNAYHPNDYGFEINFKEVQTGEEELIHHVLMENQDTEQNYLVRAAEILKTSFRVKLH